jgi:hypothetical protein
MPTSVNPQLSGQMLGIIAQAQDNNRLLEVNSNGYVQEASRFSHFVVALKSFFTGTDYKAQSHDSAKQAFISRLKSDVLSTEQNGAAVWEHLQAKVQALYWSPGQLGVEFNAKKVINDLETAFGEINLKNYEFTRSAGGALQTFQNKVTVGGVTYEQGMHVGEDPKTMDRNSLPEVKRVPGLYGHDSGYGFQTEKAQNIFLEKYSAANTSGLPALLLKNRDQVSPKSELALMATNVHDHLLESALKSLEVDHEGKPLNEEDFELGTREYQTILFNIDLALKSETPIGQIHELLLQDFDDLIEPTAEFLRTLDDGESLNAQPIEKTAVTVNPSDDTQMTSPKS